MNGYTIELQTATNETSGFHDRDDDAVRRVLSYSQLSSWLHCRYAWRMKYDLRLKAPKVSKNIELGDCVHRYLSAYLLGQNPEHEMRDWVEEQVSRMGQLISLAEELAYEEMSDVAVAIAERTLNWLKELKLQTAVVNGVPMVEANATIRGLPGWDSFETHIDWVAIDPYVNGAIQADFKTRKNFMDARTEETNLQNVIYLVVCRMLGISCNAAATIQIMSSLPATPKVNQDGRSISRSAIRTDWQTYRDAVLRAGGDPADYADMEAKLSNTKFHEITRTLYSDDYLMSVWNRVVVPAAAEIAAARDAANNEEGRVVRSLGAFNCRNCDVQDICVGVMQGYDPGYLIDQFRFKPEHRKRALQMLS